MRKIPGFHGYFATEEGRIVSLRSSQPRVLAERLHKGYLHVQIWEPGHAQRRKVPVHRLVLLAYQGEPRGRVGRHMNGRPLDNSAANLRWGSATDNVRDSIRHGTAVCLRRGDAHPRTRISEAEVQRIREHLASGVKPALEAARVGTSVGYIYNLKYGFARAGAGVCPSKSVKGTRLRTVAAALACMGTGQRNSDPAQLENSSVNT